MPQSPIPNAIMNLLRDRGAMTAKEIKAALPEYKEGTVQSHIIKLQAKRWIVSGAAGWNKLYTMTQTGRGNL